MKDEVSRHRVASGGSGKTDEAELGRFVCGLIEIQTELKSFVAHLMPFTDARDDIVQEVNLLVMEKRRQFEPGTNFRAWVYTFARNVTMKRQKRARERREFAFDPEVMERLAEDFREADPVTDERLPALQRCLAKMTGDERALLLGRYERRGATVEAADERGTSAAAVRGVLHRLRIALRRCVERELRSLARGPA